MLTIDAASACDVCSNAYGPTLLPYSIPCGHNFCRGCLDTISASAKGPACPLCRDPFNTQSIRLIRVDLCDPLPPLSYDNFPISDETDSDLSDRARSPWNSDARIRDEARILELKVAKAASTKCTFDEVSDLHKEIQDWLLTDARYKPNGKFAALRLSAALLRAILLNSLAYSDANKMTKDRISELEESKTSLEAEVRRQKQQYSEKQLECAQLQAEIERLRRSPLPGAAPLARSSHFPAPSSPPPSSTATPPPQTRHTPPTSATMLPSLQTPTRVPPPRPPSRSVPAGTPGAPAAQSHRRTPSLRSPPTSPSSATIAHATYLRSTQTSPTPSQHPRSALENIMYRPIPSAIPRSMTAPLPPQGSPTPPPVRVQTRPKAPLRTGPHERWLPVIEDTDVETNDSPLTGFINRTLRTAAGRR